MPTHGQRGRDVPPVIDLHCDLLDYLAGTSTAGPDDASQIGCALPHLRGGNVRLQVLAIYTATGPESVRSAGRQAAAFRRLLEERPETLRALGAAGSLESLLTAPPITVVAALENASGLVAEDEPLGRAFERLDRILALTGPLLYVSLTHFGDNRFGGGSGSQTGLTVDGRALLDHLRGRGTAVDLSHAGDALAFDVVDHVDRAGLDLPIIASHSNFRAAFAHPRNLPAELAGEIVRRGGLIGMCFLRAYVHPEWPAALLDHIAHGVATGAGRALSFGADFFAVAAHPDSSREPYFFPEYENAGCYGRVLEAVQSRLGSEHAEAIAYGNALDYLRRVWRNDR